MEREDMRQVRAVQWESQWFHFGRVLFEMPSGCPSGVFRMQLDLRIWSLEER
jgi:hypothetical protein